MKHLKAKAEKRDRRRTKIRARIHGTEATPRLSVFRSNKYIYAQIINDDAGKTLASATSLKAKGKTMVEKSRETGIELAKKAKALGVAKVVFDRGGFIFTGKIKALADGAREGGLSF